MHLSRIGDFQVSQIDAFNLYNIDKKKNLDKKNTRVDKTDPAKQKTFNAENVPDSMKLSRQSNKLKKFPKT